MAKLKDVTNRMRSVLMSLGHFEGENMRLLAKFYVFLTIFLLLGTMMVIAGSELEEKIFCFKNINILVCGLVFPLVNGDTYRLLTVTDDSDSADLGIVLTQTQKSFRIKRDSELDKVVHLIYIVTVVSCSLPTFGPALTLVFTVIQRMSSETGAYITAEDLPPLPINIWYPEQFSSNTFMFVLLYALQTFYMYLYAGYMYSTLVAGLVALKKTINDMKLLCLIINDLDRRGSTDKMRMGNTVDLNMEESNHYTHAPNIREDLINVIKLHDSICRKVTILNSALEKMYTVFNNAICFQICVCLYSSAKMKNFILKVEYLLLTIPLASIIFLYCSIAQNILDEGDNFRKSLWESSFVDKPKWFRTSLLLMMTRSSKDLEIKPFGFYVLNLRTFSAVLNAAYSYFNMLNSLQSRIEV